MRKIWTALDEAEHISRAEWTLWFLGAVRNFERPERRCGLAPSNSVDNTRGQEVEELELQRLQA